MLPTGNRTGSVRVLSLRTGKIITRDQFKVLPMPLSVIAVLNAMAAADGNLTPPTLTSGDSVREFEHSPSHLPTLFTPHPHLDDDPGVIPHDVPRDGNEPELADEVGLDTSVEANTQEFGHSEAGGVLQNNNLDHLPEPNHDLDEYGGAHVGGGGEHRGDHIDSGGDIRGDSAYSGGDTDHGGDIRGDNRGVDSDNTEHLHIGGDIGRDPATESSSEPEVSQAQHITRNPPGGRVLDFFRRGGTDLALMSSELMRETEHTQERAMNITVREAIRTRGEEAERVIMKELNQMINKRVWTLIDGKKLTAEERSSIIRSSMFLKEKYLASGEFEKLKARLVAGGDQQNKDMYDDLSAPTVSTSAVFTILAIAAHEQRNASVVDIGGAFLNAEMKTGVAVHMRLDAAMSNLLIRLQPSYRRFQDTKGCIVVLLNRALYGCVESAALLYDNLRETMRSLGYERNPHEICVFNKTGKNGVQCTAAVHVDDLLITSAESGMIDELSEGLRLRYGEITRTSGSVLNYLGMVLDLSQSGEARVSMKGFVEDMLLCSGVNGGARTPATDGLFELRTDATTSTEEKRKEFHSLVAKLLCLAKKTRPDCLTTVAFLATRVSKCTDQDWEKLIRLLKYVNATKERGIVLRPGRDGIIVKVYVDASYGVHPDGKSHTGCCIVVGATGPVHCKSAKQQIVTKSLTEAELVALSDSASQGLHLRQFVIAQGYTCGPVTLYQDNMSTMALIERGRSAGERTRHIDIRYFWVKERVDSGEAIVRHLGTKDMCANLLTKPLQGAQFVSERDALTGWISQD